MSENKFVRGDEYIHLHSIWMVSQEKLPYRDYFDHHAPWYHLLMSYVCTIYEPETSSDAAVKFMQISRYISLLTTFCGLCILAVVGWMWKDCWHGLATIVILTGFQFFLETAIEIRPDVPAFFLWMGALLLIRIGFGDPHKSDADEWKNASVQGSGIATWKWFKCPFLWAGLLLGIAVMFTQKMLFVLPGIGISLCGWLWFSKTRIIRFWCLVRFGFSFLVPTFLTFAYFTWNGSGHHFIDCVFLINASWPEFPEQNMIMLMWFYHQSWFLVTLGLLGVIWLYASMGRCGYIDWFAMILIATVIGWFIGYTWIIPVADRQFFMIPLPLVALLGACGVQEYIRIVLNYTRQFCRLFCKCFRIPVDNAVAGLLRMSWESIRIISLLGCVLLMVLKPITSSLRNSSVNKPSDFPVKWVVDNTSPTDTVLGTLAQGAGTFRMQAWYYGFMHREILHVIDPEAVQQLLVDLRSGNILPDIISLRSTLTELHPDLLPWINDNYQPVPEVPSLMQRMP